MQKQQRENAFAPILLKKDAFLSKNTKDNNTKTQAYLFIVRYAKLRGGVCIILLNIRDVLG